MGQYKAFISYKHATSRAFAAAFELELKRYAKPLFARPFRVFRDEKHLTPGIDLSKLIADALNASEFLILLASREATSSVWVRDELLHWCGELGRTENLLIVLTEGTIAIDEERKGIDWEQTDALPQCLKPYLTKVPLFVDFAWVRPKSELSKDNPEFKAAINSVSARLRGIDPNDMLGEEILQHRRTLRIRNFAIAVMIALTILAGYSKWVADRSARVAQSREKAAQARLALATDPEEALRLAVEAADNSPTAEAERVLRDVLLNPALQSFHAPQGLLSAPSLDPTGRFVAAASHTLSAGHEKERPRVVIWEVAKGALLYELKGHSRAISSLSFSPDGKYLVSVSLDQTAIVWDPEMGTRLATLRGHNGPVFDAFFMLEGKVLVTAGNNKGLNGGPIAGDTTARVWKTGSWEELRVLDGQGGFDGDFARQVYADGNHVITRHAEDVRVWNPQSNKPRFSLTADDFGSVICINRSGQLLLEEHSGGELRVWDLKSGEIANRFDLGFAVATAVRGTFSSDDTLVTVVTNKGATLVIDIEREQLIHQFGGYGTVNPDGTLVAFSNTSPHTISTVVGLGSISSNVVAVADVKSGAIVSTLSGHREPVDTSRFRADGKRLLTTSGGVARLWRIRCGTALRGHQGPVICARYSPDGASIATASGGLYEQIGLLRADGTARLWDATRMQPAQVLDHRTSGPRHRQRVHNVCFSRAGKLVATAADEKVRLWDAATGVLVAEFSSENETFQRLAFSPDDRFLSACGTGPNRVYDVAARKFLYQIAALDGYYAGPGEFDHSSRFLVAPVGTGAIVCRANSGQVVRTLRATGDALFARFSSDGQRIVTAGIRHLCIWDAERGQLLHNLGNQEDIVTLLRINHSGTKFVTCHSDGSARLWDLATATLKSRLAEHAAEVLDANFSPDDRFVVTGSADGSARVWDAETCRELTVLVGHHRAVNCVEFRPDGKAILTASSDGTGRVHEFRHFGSIDELLELAAGRTRP